MAARSVFWGILGVNGYLRSFCRQRIFRSSSQATQITCYSPSLRAACLASWS